MNMTTFEERLSRLEGVYDHLASKADMGELKVDIQKDMTELKVDIQKDMTELKVDIQKDIGELKVEIERSKAETSSRFDGVEGRLDRIENRLDKLIFALFGAGLAFGVGMAVLIVRSFAAG